ncbi:MAG: HAD-IA family hydrolase [Alphaproteobacteria bacterium]|nr:HAD-IA family hydrolase [Alphaproteobacteria bacterium]
MKHFTIVWDLDNTLYRETPQFHDRMDEITAQAAIEDFNLPLDLATAKAMVTESYRIYRDGGEIFCQKYGIDPMELAKSYHKRKEQNLHLITPYEHLAEDLQKLACPQYIFSTSSRDACAAILKHIGLYDFFVGRFYSVEDFDRYKKNESADVYLEFCQTAGLKPENCIFVDDSYSNLEFAKKAGMTTMRLCHGKPNDMGTEFIDYASDNINECLQMLSKICRQS